MTAAFSLILGLADILLRGFLLAMACGVVFLWMLHRAAASSWQLRAFSQVPQAPRLVPPRPEAYRLRSARGPAKR